MFVLREGLGELKSFSLATGLSARGLSELKGLVFSEGGLSELKK